MSHFSVRSTSNDSRVVLWERNEAHPGGEVFVAGPQPVLAGMTRRVQALLQEGRLELVEPEAEADSVPGEEEAVNDVPPLVDPSSPQPTTVLTAEIPDNVGINTGSSSSAGEDAKEQADAEHELIRIDGISETRLKALQKLGVNSYADLLAGDSETLAQALPRVNVAMVEDWKRQTLALAGGS